MRKLLLIIFIVASSIFPSLGGNISLTSITTNNGLPQNSVRSIVQDRYGFLWIGTWDGLCRYDGNQFVQYRTALDDSTSIPNNRIHRLYIDGQQDLWVSTFGYLMARYNYETDDFEQFQKSQRPDSIKPKIARQIGYDIIKGIPKEILAQVGDFEPSATGDHLVIHNSKLKIEDPNINCALYDKKEQILWLGTTFGGVCKISFKQKPFEVDRLDAFSDGTSKSIVRAVWVEGDELWLGAQNVGLMCKPIRPNELVKILDKDDIRSVYRDVTNKSVWFGTRSNLYRYSVFGQETTTIKTDSLQKNYQRFYAIAEGTNNNLWLGTDQAVLYYDLVKERFDEMQTIALGNANTTCILQTSPDTLWIGSEAGAICLSKEAGATQWSDTIYMSTDSNYRLVDNRVYSIAKGSNSDIWIGTANGLCRFDPLSKETKRFTEQDGLTNAYITKVLSDRDGTLWLSHKKGISRIKNGAISNFTISNMDFEFVERSGMIDKSTGKVYFGGTDGYVSFYPEYVHHVQSLGQVVLTGLEVQDEAIAIGDTINERVILDRALSLSDTLQLNYAENTFSIGLSLLDYSPPADVTFAYQIDGFGEDWEGAIERSINFYDLPAGTYHLNVKALANNQSIESEVRSLTIIIAKPWWKQWWAYGNYILLMLALGLWVRKRLITPAPIGVMPEQAVIVNNTDQEFLNEATSTVLQNIANTSFDVDALVEALNMSRTPFYKKLKEITGQTAREFILQIRLKRAVELLLSTDESISEIAYQLGFSSPGNFTRSFQKQHGKSPKVYREENTVRR